MITMNAPSIAFYNLGCFHGTVTDETGLHVRQIEVDIIRIFEPDRTRSYFAPYQWANDQGNSMSIESARA
jgi:hypothetical protein